MARLLKRQEVSALTPDTQLSRTVREYLSDRVRYSDDVLDAVVAEYGTNAEIAIALTGATSKKDKSYVAAIRWLQHARRGDIRFPSLSKYAPRIVDLLVQRNAVPDDILAQVAQGVGSLNVQLSGTVTISQITEYRDNWHADMDAETASDFLIAALDDSLEGYNVFADAGNYPPFAQVFSDARISF